LFIFNDGNLSMKECFNKQNEAKNIEIRDEIPSLLFT
jgi:hypothetical protein